MPLSRAWLNVLDLELTTSMIKFQLEMNILLEGVASDGIDLLVEVCARDDLINY